MFGTHRIRAPREQARGRRESVTFFVALLALCFLLVFLGGCALAGAGKAALTAPLAQAPFAQQVRVHVIPAPNISTTVRTGQEHLYTFSTSNVGLMQPAVDAQGNVWVGEMHANRLGRLNSRTGAVTNWTPPEARYGIMTTTIDVEGNVWFAEQNANYIGRFDPRQQAFRIFPLGTWKGSPLGPQDLQFDRNGSLWFTAVAAGAIGRLDPRSGAIRLWPVPSPAPGIPSAPYSLTITPTGRVWFGEMAGGAIGSLDPLTNHITLYHLPNSQVMVYAMATDAAGRLWFTEVLPGRLGMFDPATDSLIELPVPTLAGGPPALYNLVVDRQEHIWFVDVGANMLVCYSPGKRTLTFFQLSLPSSAPFGLTLDPSGKLWFTAGGAAANYVGEMTP